MKGRVALGTRSGQRGVTLLEVLITMVVMSLGLLGFAALQTVSMKSNRTALYRSYATTYAYEIIDCIRANRAHVANYAIAMTANLPGGDGSVAINGTSVTITVQWDESPSVTKSFTTSSSL